MTQISRDTKIKLRNFISYLQELGIPVLEDPIWNNNTEEELSEAINNFFKDFESYKAWFINSPEIKHLIKSA